MPDLRFNILGEVIKVGVHSIGDVDVYKLFTILRSLALLHTAEVVDNAIIVGCHRSQRH